MAIPLPDAAGTPSVHTEDAWRYNEDADIKLLCLRLFAVLHRSYLLQQPLTRPVVRLGELLCCLNDSPELRNLTVRVPTDHVVRAEISKDPLLPSTLLSMLSGNLRLPWAAINKDKTRYADSMLVLELDQPAPLSCCPLSNSSDSKSREYKNIAKEHQKLLAVLIQSKHHRDPDSACAESFKTEYLKCINTPIPFIFILISDAATVTYSQHISWPYNGNGFFVGGHDQLAQLYGQFLYTIRAESWLNGE